MEAKRRRITRTRQPCVINDRFTLRDRHLNHFRFHYVAPFRRSQTWARFLSLRELVPAPTFVYHCGLIGDKAAPAAKVNRLSVLHSTDLSFCLARERMCLPLWLQESTYPVVARARALAWPLSTRPTTWPKVVLVIIPRREKTRAPINNKMSSRTRTTSRRVWDVVYARNICKS